MASPATVSAVLRLPVDQVDPGPNARGALGDVDELALSIRTLGLQTPLTVCELEGGRYQVIDGHRRLAAIKRAGLRHVDAFVRQASSPKVRLLQQLAMHANGKGFDPISEAKALHTLMWEHNQTREQIAAAVGKSPNWVRDRIALNHLEPGEREAVRTGRMSLAQAAATLAYRRAERDGRPAPASTRPSLPTPTTSPASRTGSRPHCPTCQCPTKGPST